MRFHLAKVDLLVPWISAPDELGLQVVSCGKNGRVESVAVAPGTPGIEAQEKRDGVPTGTYHRLVADGVLTTDGDLRVPRVKTLVDKMLAARPRSITCDRFRPQ